MTGYDWIYGRNRGAGPQGRGFPSDSRRNGQRPPSRARYDAGMGSDWGAHYGESYIENFGSYGTEPEAAPYLPGRSARGRFDGSGAHGQRPGQGYGARGPEPARGGYSIDFSWSLGGERDGGSRYDRGYGAHGPGSRYDGWFRGRRRGG